MLKLTVQLSESFDEETSQFVSEDFVLELEHSLVSLSKWESEFEKPFLAKGEKTTEEVLGYIRAMILNPVYPQDILEKLSQENFDQINRYIEAKMTATWFNEPKPTGPNQQTITSELVYYWMTSYQIPWEAENWHLNRLFTLIKVFNAQNVKPKKMSAKEMAEQRRALNEQRRTQYRTRG